LFWCAIDVGAQVQHAGAALDGRHHLGDGRSFDARDGLEDKACGCHQCAGIAGRHGGLRLAFLHEIDRHPHGRIFLVLQGELRRLVHAYHLGGMLDTDARTRNTRMAGQFSLDGCLVSDKNQIGVGMVLQELDRCWDGDLEANVTAHCINRDGDSHQRVR
jgi:hypothetical protein